MKLLFVFTLGIVILNLIKVISILFGKNSISWPSYKWLSPTEWWSFYPSFFLSIILLVNIF